MTGLARETRLQIMLDENELSAIDDWRFRNRMPSRAAAVRQLLKIGLQTGVSRADANMRSQDFGLLNDDKGPEE